MNPEMLQAGAAGTLSVVFLLAVIAFIIIIIVKGFRIVQQAEVVIIERLGKYHKTLQSGVNIIVPLLDKPRPIITREARRDPHDQSKVMYITVIKPKIDLREIVMDFPKQNVITKDNVTIEINALLYFQVTDPVRALYEVQNLPDAIEKLTQTTLRNVIGELDLDQTLSSRDTINSKLRAILDDATDKWGVKVNRVELQDINPPLAIRDDMEKQMRAERERRALVLEAEGIKESQILRAEGERQAAIAKAEGAKRSKVLNAEGEMESRTKIAEGEARAVQILLEAVGTRGDPVQYMVAMKYIEALTAIASSPQKTVFLPYEAAGVMSSLGGLKEMFKDSDKGQAPTLPRRPVV
jgi:regulator of protease activity HflC (stomatin/prohibitin superfamily)